MPTAQRKVCFVTGTRAEFGLMRSTLRAIQSQPHLDLQLVVTGMHLDRKHGRRIDAIRREGWTVDAVPWPSASNDPDATAAAMGGAIAGLARVFAKLRPDVVLVCGDRVEAFAAAAAGHVAQRVVAHVHGGDRAQGQVDDALRHAITKLAHIHFAATRQSAARISKLGEDGSRIHVVGAPGLDGILEDPLTVMELRGLIPDLRKHFFALVVLHPDEPSEAMAFDRASMLLRAVRKIPYEQIVIVAPNNDPGAAGIFRAWESATKRGKNISVHRDLPRRAFLALLRDAAVLVGNSSAGIIEAASFGTPVVNIGPRQLGRERSGNVTDVPYGEAAVGKALKHLWNRGKSRRFTGRNVYGGGAGERIASVLGRIALDGGLRRKLITY